MPSAAGCVNIEEAESLLRYLRERRFVDRDENPRFQILRGGVSNRTVLVRRMSGEDWVLKQALRKLRVAVDWFSAPERIHREAKGLRWLGDVIPGHVPRYIFEDEQHHILGMTAVAQPHENWKHALLSGRTSIEQAQSFGRLLARIHSAVESNSGLRDEFAERRFFEELRLEPYYGYTASQVPEARDFLQRLTADTGSRRVALVHGDYSPKNVLVYKGRLMLLDHEVIHFGDPAFDVGFSLAHFLGKALHLPRHRADFLGMARAYWRRYSGALSSQMVEAVCSRAARHTLACMLARVAGRSPLEYLDSDERRRMQQIALRLIHQDLDDLEQLFDEYERNLAQA
ncbi:MAG: aminoglycoside phosphotransferase family protein [Chloroflexi bacterium]|nr:aminoglycoside phosphotransferase family protein [Chloroflexota bacterium]